MFGATPARLLAIEIPISQGKSNFRSLDLGVLPNRSAARPSVWSKSCKSFLAALDSQTVDNKIAFSDNRVYSLYRPGQDFSECFRDP